MNRCLIWLLLLATCLWPVTTAATPAEEERPGRGEREVVLIHGLGSSAKVWDTLAPYLHGSFDVWNYELPGHGTTPPLPGLTIEKAAEDLARFLREQDITYPVLVGHAMGGLIAMRYAFDQPGDIKQLIVIDATPRQLATPEQKINATEVIMQDYDRFVASQFLHMSPREDVTDQIVDQALRTDSASFISLLMSGFDFDLTEELPRQAIPILVIGSALFFPDPEQAQERLGEMGYGSARTISFKRMANTGHFIMLERPAYLASVIIAFIISQGRH